jgi:hypothetical protein
MPTHDRSRPALAPRLGSDDLVRAVPELAPEALHQLILHRGLDASGDLVAAATDEQLTSVFDLDLWQSPKPGLAETLDVRRFGEWMEALVDHDPSQAARTVAALDARLAIAAISRYIRVFDPGTFERVVPTEEVDHDLGPPPFDGLSYECAGYVIRARRIDNWDAIVSLLNTLQDDHPDRFDEVMHGCRRLSNSAPEVDGLDDLRDLPGQALHDATLAREDRQSARGYVTPADARAFLEMARRARHHAPEAHQQPQQSQQSRQPRQQGRQQSRGPSPGARPSVVAPNQDDLRALIARPGGDDANQTRMWRAMRHLGEQDADIFDQRMSELAYLAGTLVAGCSLGDRPFTPREAHDAAIAICNIGLEQWPGGGLDMPPPHDFLMTHGLVTAFETGWVVLYEQVSLFVADRLIATLRELRCDDVDMRRGLIALERELMKHRSAGAPWRVRNALDVIAMLDMPAWTSLLGLLSECPVLPAALTAILTGDIRPIDAQAFEFIDTTDRIREVRAFMTALPDVLLR